MAETSDEQERRAAKLREEIQELKHEVSSETRRPARRVKRSISPHEYIQRRMHELKQDAKEAETADQQDDSRDAAPNDT